MYMSFVDSWILLPIDVSMRTFLNRFQVPVPSQFNWKNNYKNSRFLLHLIGSHIDTPTRDQLITEVLDCTRFANESGVDLLYQACLGDKELESEIRKLQSDLHRSFWTMVMHSDVYALAVENDTRFVVCEPNGEHHVCILKRRPSVKSSDISLLKSAIKELYLAREAYVPDVYVNLMQRSTNVWWLSLQFDSKSESALCLKRGNLERVQISRAKRFVLEYSCETGMIRTIGDGLKQGHHALVELFIRYQLGGQYVPTPRPVRLDLSKLKLGLLIAPESMTGFVGLQVQSISLIPPEGMMKIKLSTLQVHHGCVIDLIKEKFNADLSVALDWSVNSAAINVIHFPQANRHHTRVINVEITSGGRLNLHRFDPLLQGQLEQYLTHLGVMDVGKTLSVHAQEHPLSRQMALDLDNY